MFKSLRRIDPRVPQTDRSASVFPWLPLLFSFRVSMAPTIVLLPCFHGSHYCSPSVFPWLPLLFSFRVSMAPTVVLLPCFHGSHYCSPSVFPWLPLLFSFRVSMAPTIVLLPCFHGSHCCSPSVFHCSSPRGKLAMFYTCCGNVKNTTVWRNEW